MDELEDRVRELRRLFRRRLDAAAAARGARLVDLSVVETTVREAIADLERALRELDTAPGFPPAPRWLGTTSRGTAV